MQNLDHVVIAVNDLAQASADYRALGFTVLPGGTHANNATHNALICFADGTYIELLALTGTPARPSSVDFSALLADGEGLRGYALRCDDLESESAAWRADGAVVGAIISGERLRPDGVRLAWKLALIDGGFAPFLIQDVTARLLRVPGTPEATTHANACSGIHQVDVGAGRLELVSSAARVLDFDPTLTHGVRLTGAGKS